MEQLSRRQPPKAFNFPLNLQHYPQPLENTLLFLYMQHLSSIFPRMQNTCKVIATFANKTMQQKILSLC
jgi:hypothetical protein